MELTQRETHFEFGKNWRDYAKTIDERRISPAVEEKTLSRRSRREILPRYRLRFRRSFSCSPDAWRIVSDRTGH